MKRILFLTLAVLLSTLSASAYDFRVDGIAYEKNDDGKSVAVCADGYYTGNITRESDLRWCNILRHRNR